MFSETGQIVKRQSQTRAVAWTSRSRFSLPNSVVWEYFVEIYMCLMKPPSEHSFSSTSYLFTVYDDRIDRKVGFLGYSVNACISEIMFEL